MCAVLAAYARELDALHTERRDIVNGWEKRAAFQGRRAHQEELDRLAIIEPRIEELKDKIAWRVIHTINDTDAEQLELRQATAAQRAERQKDTDAILARMDANRAATLTASGPAHEPRAATAQEIETNQLTPGWLKPT